MSEQTPQSREKVKPHRSADGGSDPWWNTEVTVPAHYAATVEIEGIPVTVWVDEDDEEYLADGKLTIDYLRRKSGIQILSIRD